MSFFHISPSCCCTSLDEREESNQAQSARSNQQDEYLEAKVPGQTSGSAARPALLMEVVSTSNVFVHIAKDRLADLVSAFKGPMIVSAGQTIIRQRDTVGDDEPGLFVLVDGSASCYIVKATETPPGNHVFTFDKPGQVFGQIALLYDCPRTASIIAKSEAVLWHLDRVNFKLGTDGSYLERIVARHAETVAQFGINSPSLSREFGMFDVDLVNDGPKRLQNMSCYYNLVKGYPGVTATQSCYSHWDKHKKTNGHGKVIPAVPVSSGDAVRIFFFDDNIEWAGKEDSSGICNLRSMANGDFIEFAEGSNGFSLDHMFRYTTVMHSSDFKNVIVQANILDAMESPTYFTDIVEKYSKPDEKNIVFMDINGTIMSSCSMSGKDMTTVLLGTMLEFITLETPKEPSSVEWDDKPPVKLDKQMNVKQLVKKISGSDKDFYTQFFKYDNCIKILELLASKTHVTWPRHDLEFSVQNFTDLYEHYIVALVGSTNDVGLTKSWFAFYSHAIGAGSPIAINSFGMDMRATVIKTVADEREVVYMTVAVNEWGPKDMAAFKKAYGVTLDDVKTGP